MELARRVRVIKESATLKSIEKAKEAEKRGVNIIYLSVGEPDFDTPEHIKKAAYDAIASGFTHYTVSQGIPELREAIAEKLQDENRINVNSSNIIVTPGAKHAVLEAVLALIDDGDEALIPAPSWVSYEEIVRIAGGIVKRLSPDEHYKVAPQTLEDNISRKTKLLILNSPNNPTGAVYTEQEMRALADVIMEKGIYVITDEIYEKIIYEGKHFSIGSIPGMENLTVTINGFSKSYAMTGWRLGYAAGPREIIAEMKKIQEHSVSCAASFVQKAGVVALRSSQDCVKEMVKEFKERRNFIIKELSKMGSLEIESPSGAFYIFPDISRTKMSSTEFSDFLLEKAGVIVTPGLAFSDYDSNIRISYANSIENIREAIERIKEVLS